MLACPLHFHRPPAPASVPAAWHYALMARLILRSAVLSDSAAIAAIYASYVLDTSISFEDIPPTGDLVAARMAASPSLPWWVAVDGETVVGYAYASAHR